MQLETFSFTMQKSVAYQYSQAFSLSDALQKLASVQKEGIYFRGQAESTWKIYSSMQREWIEKELHHRFGSYQNFAEALLNYAYANYQPILKNYCKLITDISIFSTLQHYGAPTPFIDWPSDYLVALYFASLGNDFCHRKISDEIESFFSIYWVEKGRGAETPENDLTDINRTLEDANAQLEQIREDWGSVPGSDLKSATQYKTWGNLPIILMRHGEDKLMHIENRRSNLQSGLFIYSSDPLNSLDKRFSSTAKSLAELPETDDLILPKIHCLDIHKSVLPQLKAYLSSRSYTTETLGLSTDDWGKKLYTKFLSEPHS